MFSVWQSIAPLKWSEADVFNWFKNMHNENIIIDISEFGAKLKNGKFICKQNHEFFEIISPNSGIELFEDLQIIISVHEKHKYLKISKICQFLFENLENQSNLIIWIDRNCGLFEIIEPELFAQSWGKRNLNYHMNYRKMRRTIDNHSGKEIIQHQRKNIYQFRISFLKLLLNKKL